MAHCDPIIPPSNPLPTQTLPFLQALQGLQGGTGGSEGAEGASKEDRKEESRSKRGLETEGSEEGVEGGGVRGRSKRQRNHKGALQLLLPSRLHKPPVSTPAQSTSQGQGAKPKGRSQSDQASKKVGKK